MITYARKLGSSAVQEGSLSGQGPRVCHNDTSYLHKPLSSVIVYLCFPLGLFLVHAKLLLCQFYE